LPLPPSSTLFPYTTLFRSPEIRQMHQHLLPRLRVHRPRLGIRVPPIELEVHEVVDHPDRPLHSERRRRAFFEVAADRRNVVALLDRKSTRLNSSHDQISYA